MRMATGWPSTFNCACVEICCCICAAAFSAASALGNVAMTSSPMVLITVPWRCSVALRITSMQVATMSRARKSPMVSYSRVDPTTSANSMASSMSLPMSAARLYASAFGPLAKAPAALLWRRGERHGAPQQLGAGAGNARSLAQRAAKIAGARLAAIEPQHMARDRAEALAGCELTLAVARHALQQRGARRRRGGLRRERPMQLREHERPVIRLTAQHDAVAPGERGQHRLRVAQSAVDHERQRRELCLEALHHVVAQRRDLAVLLRRQSAE